MDRVRSRPRTRFGTGTRVRPRTRFGTGTRVRPRTRFGTGTRVRPRTRFGTGTRVRAGTRVRSGASTSSNSSSSLSGNTNNQNSNSENRDKMYTAVINAIKHKYNFINIPATSQEFRDVLFKWITLVHGAKKKKFTTLKELQTIFRTKCKDFGQDDELQKITTLLGWLTNSNFCIQIIDNHGDTQVIKSRRSDCTFCIVLSKDNYGYYSAVDEDSADISRQLKEDTATVSEERYKSLKQSTQFLTRSNKRRR